jgi:hypothetical protein
MNQFNTMKHYSAFFFLLSIISLANASTAILTDSHQGGNLYKMGTVNLVVLEGSYQQMGEQYGKLMSEQLKTSYDNLSQVFNRVEFKLLTEFASLTRYRNSPEVTKILKGMSNTANLDDSPKKTYKKLILLDHALQFSAIARRLPAGCTFLSVWGEKSKHTKTLIARNFDWATKFFPLFQSSPTVAIFKPQNGDMSIATIGYAGWISSITGVNAHGLSISLNSGAYSTGHAAAPFAPSYFANLTQALFKSKNLNQLETNLLGLSPDTGYIVNIADKTIAESIEASPTYILKFAHKKQFARVRRDDSELYYENKIGNNGLIATNSFRLNGWQDNFILDKLLKITPYPAKGSTPTMSFLRYDNIVKALLEHQSSMDVSTLKSIMEKPIQQGGATEYSDNPLFNHENTYYSVIYDASNHTLWVRFIDDSHSPWQQIALDEYFNSSVST